AMQRWWQTGNRSAKGFVGLFAVAALMVAIFAGMYHLVMMVGQGAVGLSESTMQLVFGFGFCFMPLTLSVMPSLLSLIFLRPSQQAKALRRTGELDQALQAYQRQLEIVKRFPWLESIRGYLFWGQHSPEGL